MKIKKDIQYFLEKVASIMRALRHSYIMHRETSVESEIKYRMGDAYSTKFSPENPIFSGNQAVAVIQKGKFSLKTTSESRLLWPYLEKISIFMKDIKKAKGYDLKLNFAFQETWGQCSTPPCFSHSRPAQNTCSILWPHPLSQRFSFSNEKLRIQKEDCLWSEKEERVVWRGNSSNCSQRIQGKASRLHLMKMFYFDTDFDIGFRKIMPNEKYELNLEPYLKGGLTRKEQLMYKYIIVIEGNDIASSLPWALYSQSLVLMPPITAESIVTFRLEPWIHYVPVAEDFSDLKEKLAWCRTHDPECLHISKNATKLVGRLFNKTRERKIQRGILSKYRKNLLMSS